MQTLQKKNLQCKKISKNKKKLPFKEYGLSTGVYAEKNAGT